MKVVSDDEDISEEHLHLRRLALDGWRHVQEWQGEYLQAEYKYITHAPGIHEKTHPAQGWTLVMTTTRIKLEDRYGYQVQPAEGETVYLPKAEWAD